MRDQRLFLDGFELTQFRITLDELLDAAHGQLRRDERHKPENDQVPDWTSSNELVRELTHTFPETLDLSITET